MAYYVAGAIVVSAVVSSKSSKKAAEAQGAAASQNIALGDRQLEENRRQFDVFQQNLQPFLETGQLANQQLNRVLEGDFSVIQDDPGIQLQREEGERPINRLAARQGRLNTGAQAKDLIRFNQRLSSQSTGNVINRLLAISGRGQNAVNAGGAAGQNFIAQQGAFNQGISNQRSAAGNARATNFLNQGNLINNSLDQFIRLNAFNKGRGGGGSGGGNPSQFRPINSLTAVG